MARWEPDACGRLVKAAMDLFQERGYAETTVADIAASAGLTERTFFRYFTDKREVLFSGSKDLEQTITEAVASAPADMPPLEIVGGAVAAAGAQLQAIRDMASVRARYALVVRHAELRERELIKMASLAVAVTHALHTRGVPEPTASLAAEAGMTVFKVGFERWVGQKKPRDLAGEIRAALDALRAIATTTTKTRANNAKKKPAAAR